MTTVWEELKTRAKELVLETMFKLSAAPTLTIAMPVFCGKHTNTNKLDDVPSIDIKGKKRYIYPGESFWTDAGVREMDTAKKPKNVLQEKWNDKPSKGASSLQLKV